MKKILDYPSHFLSKVKQGAPAECWEYSGAKARWGYGIFSMGGKLIAAHRYAWILAHGEIPEGMIVCHHCDNPPCCNPNHLFIGTHKDNSDDMMGKGRNKYRPDITKLTAPQVLEIRRLYGSGEKITHLASSFGVSTMQVHRIVTGRAWRHLLPPPYGLE